jgi:hypothetical protein
VDLRFLLAFWQVMQLFPHVLSAELRQQIVLGLRTKTDSQRRPNVSLECREGVITGIVALGQHKNGVEFTVWTRRILHLSIAV